MHEWNDFYVAVAGASAALTGLIFVGISISLTKILANPALAVRAAVPLILLMSILILSILFLVPQSSPSLTGWETTIFGCIVLGIIARADIKMLRQTPLKNIKNIIFLILF